MNDPKLSSEIRNKKGMDHATFRKVENGLLGRWEVKAIKLEADNTALREKNEHLFDVFKRAENRYVELQQENAALRKRVEGLEEALEKIVQWAEAYPLDVFPEPDFKKAARVLKDAGMTLDAISASNMRHVIEGVGKMAKSALTIKEAS